MREKKRKMLIMKNMKMNFKQVYSDKDKKKEESNPLYDVDSPGSPRDQPVQGDHEPFKQSVSKEQSAHVNGGRGGKKETRTEAKLRVTSRKLNLKKISNIFKPVSVEETGKMGASRTSLNFGVSCDKEICTVQYKTNDCVSQSEELEQKGSMHHIGFGPGCAPTCIHIGVIQMSYCVKKISTNTYC